MTDRARHHFRPAKPLLAAALLCLGAVAACSPDSGRQSGDSGQAGAKQTAECGRDCLIGLLDQYLAAVVAHDPSAAPLAGDYQATQNTMPVAAGEGAWTSVTALGALQRRYADAETGQAGYIGLVGEGESTAIVSLRIDVADRQIEHAEWIIARPDTPLFNPAGFTANPPPDDAPRGDPGVTRAQAVEAAESYYDGVEAADASTVIAEADCFRIENGSWMVGRIPERAPVEAEDAQPGFNIALLSGPEAACVGGFQNFRGITSAVSGRRYFFDQAAGVLWATALIERVEGARDRDGNLFDWVYMTNIFRFEDGKIRGIHSFTYRMPPAEGARWAD